MVRVSAINAIKKSTWVGPGLLTGVLVGTSYVPFPPWAALFCFYPLWKYWANEKSLKNVFLSGWLAQFVLTLIGFHWVAHTAKEFGHLPSWLSFLILIGFAAHANLHIALAGWVWKKWWCRTPSFFSFLFLAILTHLGEEIYPSIFPWNFGYTWFWSSTPMYQTAEIWGMSGLSLITLVFNASIIWAFQSDVFKKPRLLKIGFVFLALNGFGLHLQRQVLPPNNELKVLMVQANIGNFEKFLAEKNSDFRSPIIQKYFQLTNEALKNSQADLIFWPETAFPANLNESFLRGVHQQQLISFVQSMAKPLLTGGYSEHSDGQYFNGLFSLSNTGAIEGKAYKYQLLAFGEYFPLSDKFPVLKKIIPAISDFGRGAGPQVIMAAGVPMGAQICYEGLFSWFSQTLVRNGALVLANVTNDSWFGHRFESRQHLYMTLARAVEYRRPLMRVTNTGISSVVNASGEILVESPEQTEWAQVVRVPYSDVKLLTIWSYIAHIWVWIVLAVTIAIGVFIKRHEKS